MRLQIIYNYIYILHPVGLCDGLAASAEVEDGRLSTTTDARVSLTATANGNLRLAAATDGRAGLAAPARNIASHGVSLQMS